MKDFLPFQRSEVGEEEVAEVVEVLRSGWLTTGPKVREFEREFAAVVGAEHAIAVNSCTAALHLALEAAGVCEGDEVLVPTMTSAATAEMVTYFKARAGAASSLLQPAAASRDRASTLLMVAFNT